jgi:N6-adenosine-specific RNA methylase IME4
MFAGNRKKYLIQKYNLENIVHNLHENSKNIVYLGTTTNNFNSNNMVYLESTINVNSNTFQGRDENRNPDEYFTFVEKPIPKRPKISSLIKNELEKYFVQNQYPKREEYRSLCQMHSTHIESIQVNLY